MTDNTRAGVQPVKGGPSEAAVGHGTCPTCGASVAVVGSDEGTMHFKPIERQRTLQEVEAWLESREVGTARINDFRREFGATTHAE